MEILTHPIRIDHDDMEARTLKAEAMRKWGYLQPNIYWRGLALGGALELEDQLDYSQVWNFSAPDIIRALPASAVIESARVKLDPEKAADANLTIGFRFTDVGEENALEVRRGVAVFHDTLPDETDATLIATKALLDRMLLGEISFAEAVADGELTIEGDSDAIATFFGYFDPPSDEPIKLVVR
jgi:alkyl sulfatase BDS1-like metallo-beta-lactamase superfamily hydrolase